MQSNIQSRSSAQSSECIPVQVQDDDMNISSNASHTHGNDHFQTLQMQQVQYLATCANQQMLESQSVATTNPLERSTTIPSLSAVTNETIPPNLMINFLIAASAIGFTSGLGAGMNPTFPLATMGLTAPPASAHKPKSLIHTPVAFRHCRLRSGKWIEEEEKYAELLIELFEKGRIPHCENGSTLRSFLSQKLHCAPMRISKKYAGKGIGKMVYNDRSNITMTPESQAQQNELVSRVGEAHDRFIEAAIPSQNAASNSLSCFGSLSTPQLLPGLISSTSSQKHGAPHALLPPSFSINTGMINSIPSRGRSEIMQNFGSGTASFTNKELGSHDAAKAILEKSARSLHRSFLDAFHQSDNSTKTSKSYHTTTSKDLSSPIQERIQTISLDLNHKTSTNPNSNKRLSESNKHLDSFSSVSDIPNHKMVSRGDTDSFSEQHRSNSSQPSSQRLDDSHVPEGNQHHSSRNLPGTTTCNKSMCFAPKETLRESGKKDFFNPNPLFTAESYAMFAVESAMAASQHDAYLPCSKFVIDPTKNQLDFVMRTNSIDNIDGMVKLLAEQSNGRQSESLMAVDSRLDNSHDDSVRKKAESVKHGLCSDEKTTVDTTGFSVGGSECNTVYQERNTKSAYVSASDRSSNPSTETESYSALGSSRESTNSENTEASLSDGGSSVESFKKRGYEQNKREFAMQETISRTSDRKAKRCCRESATKDKESSTTYSSDADETL